jgi:tetratricopeptide (TPR) repeat protein
MEGAIRPRLLGRRGVCVQLVFLVGSAFSGFAQNSPSGVTVCDDPKLRGTAIYMKYCGACYPHCGESRPVDPRIGQAYGINEQGRQAFAKEDYDKAAELFRQAYATNPDPAYKQNEQLALSQKQSALSHAYFDRGQKAYDAGNWKLAIDEYERSIASNGSKGVSEAASQNIRLAHSNQYLEWYKQALEGKRYKEAAVYLREANQWNRNPSLAKDLNDLDIMQAEDNGVAAYKSMDYAAAERFFAQSLALNPHSAYATRMLGNCITYEALKLAEGGSVENVIAEFDRAIAAYHRGPADSHLAHSISWARSQARFTLAKLARSADDWNAVIAAHVAWASAPDGDDQARKELAKIRVARAGNETSHSNTAAGIQDMRDQYAAALAADPDNVNARNGQVRADEQAKRLSESQAIVRSMTARPGGASPRAGDFRRLAEKQAKAAISGSGGCPWDTSKDCHDSAEGSSVAATGQFAFVSPKEETPAQVTIHAEIVSKKAANEQLLQKLGQTSDPFQKHLIKTQLSKGEYELGVKKDDYVKAGKRHFIEQRAQ